MTAVSKAQEWAIFGGYDMIEVVQLHLFQPTNCGRTQPKRSQKIWHTPPESLFQYHKVDQGIIWYFSC